MKKRNRILALILAAAVSMSMAACGKSGADSETSTDAGVEADAGADSDAAAEDAEEPAEQEEADPFAAAQENMKEITSLDASTVMEMDMVVGANGEEQSLESVTTMAMSCIYDPLQMSMDVTVDAGEAGSMTTTMYVENTDDGCMAYMNDGSGWQSQEISVTDVDQYDFSTDMGVYLNGDYGFQAEGKDEVNGAAAYKYTGSITGDEMKDLMLSSGALDSVSRIGLDTSQVDGMLDGLGDLAINLWIDEATLYPVKYEIDMTEAMDTLMNNMIAAMGEQGEGLSMSIPKMVVSMTCSNYNGVTEISIPEEAKAN
ncbi:MAG: hypothetical protein HFI16_12510 [Lachnospiraceae bacterium]|nr:hypothetical protein [Lachnospiraceae bacterium]